MVPAVTGSMLKSLGLHEIHAITALVLTGF